MYNDFYNFLKGNHDYDRNGTYTDQMYAGDFGSAPHTTKDTSEHGRKCKCPAAHRHKAAEAEKAAVWE